MPTEGDPERRAVGGSASPGGQPDAQSDRQAGPAGAPRAARRAAAQSDPHPAPPPAGRTDPRPVPQSRTQRRPHPSHPPDPPPDPRPAPGSDHPRAEGKHLWVGDDKLWVRGVTYGPFRPGPAGDPFPEPPILEQDFQRMRAHGINAVRTYDAPSSRVLDAALRHGLWVMVGLPWEQHVAFLETRRGAARIEARVREAVRGCAGHPAVLCYAIGNEIPASIVRWHGASAVERFLARLYRAVKAEDAAALVTYVNYPTTEYLRPAAQDLISFNVYLEDRARFAAYLARLQNLAGDRPLLLAEVGLDSVRNGESAAARAVDWQIRESCAAGCAGVFVFSWTDEWYRGGEEVQDWAFGLTRRDRAPKPALAAAEAAFRDAPFPRAVAWPSVSVVVCTRNGAATIRRTLDALWRLDYPEYEVIVVDDGSTDDTAALVAKHPVRLLRMTHGGLSRARNAGLASARGDVVAFVDDDAYPDPHWLRHLVVTLRGGGHVGVGGPNFAPPDCGPVARCVAAAPGGPRPVLLTDTEAEHLPGCNMAFVRARLVEAGGFDPRFHAAGDDVDVCWRMRERGWTLGYSPAAVVWHYPRASVHAYWRQQQGYGRAEALLAEKWPQKYNAAGHVAWEGRVYGGRPALFRAWLGWRARIYHGTWGSAPFQRVYEPATSRLTALFQTPEPYLLLLAAAAAAVPGLWAGSRGWPAVLLTAAVGAPAAAAAWHAAGAWDAARGRASGVTGVVSRAFGFLLVAWLCTIQPVARLSGRILEEATSARRRRADLAGSPGGAGLSGGSAAGGPVESGRFGAWRLTLWSERWRAPEAWLGALETELRELGVPVARGGEFDDWDLALRAGVLGALRLRMAVEEHGAGRQLVRFRVRPRRAAGGAPTLILAGAAAGAVLGGAWPAAVALAAAALLIEARAAQERRAVRGLVWSALTRLEVGSGGARRAGGGDADGGAPAAARARAPGAGGVDARDVA